MGNFIFFIESIEFPLYVFLGLLVAWSLRSLIVARGEMRVAQFGLERELAARLGGRAITFLFVSIEIVVIVWAMSNISAPTWRDGLPEDQQVVDGTPFQTNVPVAGEGLELNPTVPSGGADIIQTAAPPATPPGTIVAPGGLLGCTRDQAWISIPGDGQLVFEPIQIIGTANVDDFSFYRFEIRKDEIGANFGVIARNYTEPVIDGPLGDFIPRVYSDGFYRLRMSIFDTSNNLVASCELSIVIQPPEPTPTPIGSE